MRIIHLIFEVFDECIFIDFVNQGPLTHVGRYRAIEVTVIIIIIVVVIVVVIVVKPHVKANVSALVVTSVPQPRAKGQAGPTRVSLPLRIM